MKIFWCQRGKEMREGGKLVIAETAEQALALAKKYGDAELINTADPCCDLDLPLLPQVLHDDYAR